MDPAANDIEFLTVAAFLARSHGAIGRTAIYEALRRGDIPHARIGRKIMIPSDALERLVVQQSKSDVSTSFSKSDR